MIRAKKAVAKETLIPKKVENRGLKPFKKDGVTTFCTKDGSFKILQLTDVHLGAGFLSGAQDRLAINAIVRLVEDNKPDLLVFTGDNGYPIPFLSGTSNNMREAKRFAAAVEAFEIPWAFVFGNHDTEVTSRYDKNALADFYTSCPHCLFERGEEGIGGLGNYKIHVENEDGSINHVLYFFDSNMYAGDSSIFSGFDIIHDAQVDWYERDVTALQKKQKDVKSLAFFHIPFNEYKEAWDKLRFGSPEVEYKLGWVTENDNYFGIPRKKGKIFDTMVRLGSTKGTFCGHDHLNTVSMVYKGIRLTYGMSIDYLAYYNIRRKYSQRGGTLITLSEGNTFEVEHKPLSLLTDGTLGNDVIR